MQPVKTMEVEQLQREKDELLHELENAYAQLTAVMQVSQDETRIAYSEMQEKLVVQEKKLFELLLLSSVGEALHAELEVPSLRRLVLEKICVIVPVDLASLHFVGRLSASTQRERDVVREIDLPAPETEALRAGIRTLETRGASCLLVDDLDRHPEASWLRLRPDARSAAALLLRTRTLLGILILNSRLRSNFRADQEPLLAAFGTQAAAALESTRRLQRCQELLVDVMRTHDIPASELAQRVSQNTDTDPRATLELRKVLYAALTEPRPEPTTPPTPAKEVS